MLTGNRFEEAALLAQRAETRYPEDSAILVLFAEARYAQRSWRDGVQALTRARQTDTSERVEALLEEGYLRLAGEAAQQGDARGQEANLVLGVRELPSSASLHLELAKLYFKLGAYDDAAALLQKVKELSSSLRETADSLLARIDDALKRRDAVIIPIPQGSRSIRTEATVDGANALTFIVDTGATYTTIPSSLAEALGYDTSRATRVDIRTVAGPISAPLVTIQSLSVGGYTVRNLEVLVLPSGIGPEGGLLGLNFLKHFKYSVDASRSEFRLERP